jgi:glutaminyl-tRNA synthetase
VPFAGKLWIEREDFMENPTKDFFRLSPGREVRLRAAFFVTCTGVDKDENGNITAVRCTYDPATRGGNAPDGRKVKATMHWVSCAHAVEAKVEILDHLFTDPDPAGHEGKDFLDFLNHSSRIVRRAMCEPSLKDAQPGERFQFERLAYFVCDEKQSRPGAPVFLRTTTLKDSFQKAQKKAKG